jgi:4-azaleucine resistance transporter AzlC
MRLPGRPGYKAMAWRRYPFCMTTNVSPSSPTQRAHADPVFSIAGVRRGYVAAQPLALGVFVYAVTFGLLARNTGLSTLEATVMSVAVYSGSAQTATLSGMLAGAGIGASVVTILMLNARYLLYGAALRPWLGQASTLRAYSSLYLLGDGNWVLSMKAHSDGEADAGFIFGSGIATFMPWVAGTLIGGIANEWVSDPRVFGLDFLLVAFCTALAAGLVKSRHDLLPAGVAVVAAVAVDRFASTGWTIVAAGLAAGLAAFVRTKEAA